MKGIAPPGTTMEAIYRAAIPFFVGLTLGDLATQATWSLVTSILDVPVYQFL